MGIGPHLVAYIDRCARASIAEVAGKRMLELGNQRLRTADGQKTTGKAYFDRLGVTHTSFDLNGRDGAIAIDLGKPCTDDAWRNAFDIITNAGTTEHVEPHEAQYECFKNIHEWLKPGGVAVHMVPDADALQQRGAWRGHCCNYYTHAFFERLAEDSGYTLVQPNRILSLVCVGLKKDGDAPFACDRRTFLSGIKRVEGGRVYRGINDGSRLNRVLHMIGVKARQAVSSER